MNYAEMTDFEINKAVGEIIMEGKWACKPGCAGNQSDSWYYGSVDTFVTPYPALADYCNSWTDAGPIIQGNKITILTDETTEEWSAAVVQDFCDERAFKFSNCAKTPLRAAMVTFLMMQEVK